jgi:uncharacterized membrane protein YjgN (DUF898 family)
MDLATHQQLPAASSEPQAHKESLQFHGRAGEYFRIWIVNLSLTILTLGVYSAWAKVRKNRYIYGNLEMAGSHFDYLAKPLIILRGRLLAIILLGVYIAAQAFFPLLSISFIFAISLATPWLIVRSRMFNMRYTVYRNIRFSFNRAYSEAYTAIFLYGALSVITLGMAVPLAHLKRNRMIVNNTNYGNLNFNLEVSGAKYYSAYLLGVLLSLALLIPYVVLATQVGAVFGENSQTTSAFPIVLGASVFLLYYVVGQFISAYIMRATTNGTVMAATANIDGEQQSIHRLGCDWTLPSMLGIYLTNLIAIALSLGLLVPWAQMRILRYQLNHTWVEVTGTLDDVVAGQAQEVSSIGEEIGDVFDVDIGL